MVTAATGVVMAAAPASAAPAGGCTPATATTAIPFTTPVLDWSENVGYDAGGNLWVTRELRDEVQRYDSAGRVTATVPVTSPGAVRLGPDGLMYVASGDTPTNLLPGSRRGSVVRFDPNSPAPRPQPFVTGLGMPNGMAFDDAGNLYVADSASGVVRVRPDGTVDAAWTAQSPKNFDFGAGVDGYSMNGIVVQGEALYVTVSESMTGRVLRIPIDAPSRATVVANLTLGPLRVPALPDDLAAAPDGALYIATTTGQLMRLDSRTGVTCAVLSGEPMTSVAFVPGAPDQLMVGTESGDVLRVLI
ncbi:hypothetical protein [Speluncibacter jeojiensis]|uniref:SMP-30/Gluconolactonase/LRE-like region domain-containing protein n=1 Tax=Speluncibacter jeojiensis TaxID=2710754 RepID=A0A9X4RCZ2_9ACTN|nr:hypothetical protein [Corynebacteriales bacterium D3-21]